MINYEIDRTVLLPFLPRGTELDDWQGKTIVSIVGFLFLETKVSGFSIPFHRNFEEINLRFYVRRQVGQEWRRGVVFIKEIVPRWAIATVARLAYNENYVARKMNHRIALDRSLNAPQGEIEYGWQEDKRWNYLRIKTTGAPQALKQGSEEEFITEHYWGYSLQRDGGTVEYQVEHPRWQVWQASEASFECNADRVYGAQFKECLLARPISAFIADGSAVIVRKGQRI